ncbi:TrbC/VirB2 family protein [Paenibacillus sp. YIM B09110]|uniref:TrbC/VirB2 family protein n=1 Tax=Paenibacillus sp. YIM B09110 TaxID=3126102 RepID=UPI00301C9738
MARTAALDWHGFMRGEVIPLERNQTVSIVAKTASTVHLALMPTSVFAATTAPGDATWTEIFTTVLNIADWLCAGVIVFAGVTWMFGNRTKAIEFIMGGSIGYIIVRHALDIRNWLKTL